MLDALVEPAGRPDHGRANGRANERANGGALSKTIENKTVAAAAAAVVGEPFGACTPPRPARPPRAKNRPVRVRTCQIALTVARACARQSMARTECACADAVGRVRAHTSRCVRTLVCVRARVYACECVCALLREPCALCVPFSVSLSIPSGSSQHQYGPRFVSVSSRGPFSINRQSTTSPVFFSSPSRWRFVFSRSPVVSNRVRRRHFAIRPARNINRIARVVRDQIVVVLPPLYPSTARQQQQQQEVTVAVAALSQLQRTRLPPKRSTADAEESANGKSHLYARKHPDFTVVTYYIQIISSADFLRKYVFEYYFPYVVIIIVWVRSCRDHKRTVRGVTPRQSLSYERRRPVENRFQRTRRPTHYRCPVS